jgi:hypothetical protein
MNGAGPTHRHVASTCPNCRSHMSASTGVDGPRAPKPGDFTLCAHCEALLVFTPNMTLRRFTDEDMAALSPEDRVSLCESIDRARRAIAAARPVTGPAMSAPHEAPELEGIAIELAGQLREVLVRAGVVKRLGFVLMVFEYGQAGSLAYASTADRDDTSRALEEWLARAGDTRRARMRELAQRWRDEAAMSRSDIDELVDLVLGPAPKPDGDA